MLLVACAGLALAILLADVVVTLVPRRAATPVLRRASRNFGHIGYGRRSDVTSLLGVHCSSLGGLAKLVCVRG